MGNNSQKQPLQLQENSYINSLRRQQLLQNYQQQQFLQQFPQQQNYVLTKSTDCYNQQLNQIEPCMNENYSFDQSNKYINHDNAYFPVAVQNDKIQQLMFNKKQPKIDLSKQYPKGTLDRDA